MRSIIQEAEDSLHNGLCFFVLGSKTHKMEWSTRNGYVCDEENCRKHAKEYCCLCERNLDAILLSN